MYTEQQTRDLQGRTASFLQLLPHLPAGDVEALRDVLRFHEYRYYVLDAPLVADYEYDQLYKALEAIEQQNPALIRPDSPTQRVANALNGAFATVQHLVPMLSLDNSYNAEDLIDWDRRVREGAGTAGIEYCVEPKFDGASISLIYENDLLTRGATRGDGVQGDDITTNIRQIRSVPLSARFSAYGITQIEIRGEVLLTKKQFKAFNDKLTEQNLPPLANPRNAASGSLRIKDPEIVRKRNLEAFLYHVSYHIDQNNQPPAELETHSGSLDLLWELGFRSPAKEKKVFTGIEGVIQYCQDFEAGRDDLPYEIDGMVIKVNRLDLQEKLGMTTHHPRWAIAYKFKARQATSKLRGVEFQVGRTGAITPVAKIDPVPIGGVVVGSISLFNEDVIKEKDLKIGDTVLVERAGDVIPYIVKSMAELRTGEEQPIQFPVNCPRCSSALAREEGEAVWRCINIDCPAQVVERIIHFVSKDAMDIRSFGEANVRKFYELGWLQDIPGIYRLPYDKMRQLGGFGEKSITNLQTNIEKSKSQPLHRLIFALGIRYVGETTAKTLAQSVRHLNDLSLLSLEELQSLEDVGVKVASSIYQFFRNQANIELIRELETLGLTLQSEKKAPLGDGLLSGQSFLFTGTLNRLKRSEAEEMVETRGGKLLSGVSSKLNYLVVGEDAGSKLEKARKIPQIQILSEDDFIKMMGGE
ncbi:NAD-dependent DNA ligase LigA [Flavihumibacter sp. CACIAM 22H1]|uniref:NAD-dependent DNA ligase LigA n=1 Tax=Flavihumibacter sp. CACIAM 22H1 TaxID=1812911 RepID=UPI0007A8A584|nr:NAD-dependent DNA ligase LigA [Flavihumibacter sp. CACIAM 22H1]KYP13594.1 MAG: DNA ligase (NAD(+)) LigA [Flavihumibacter sp. CACIAM 22H1]